MPGNGFSKPFSERAGRRGGDGTLFQPRHRGASAPERDIYDRLVPFAGLFNWSGPTITDPNDLGLGMCAAALGRHDDADRHFADATDRGTHNSGTEAHGPASPG